MPPSSASKLLLSVPLKVVSLVVKDVRVQVPLLLAILYYPHKLRGILPPRIYPWVTSAAFVRVLKGLIGLNIAKFVNRRLSKNALNNWKSDAKFIASREIVLITGGSSGIGEMMARDFAKRGVKVIVADLNPPQNSQAGIYFYRMDVTNSEQIASAAAEIRRDHGEVTVLVNNAGIGVGQTILEEPESVIRKVFEVNTIAHFLMVKEFLPAMIRKDHGHVVTIASMAR
jgi:all-trans-retinol dehydrogenase (NAD+)